MKIVTAVVNNPEFIEIQYYTLKKYFKGDYEFIVFNDAKEFSDFTNDGDTTLKEQIITICNKLNITCINVENNHHNTMNMSQRHADTFNTYVLKYQIENPDKYLLLDSDMFLVDYFDINKYSQYDCAIVLQSRKDHQINYFWPGLCYFDFTKMKNIELLNWNCCKDCDSGGSMHEWLKLQMNDSVVPKPDDIHWKNNIHNTDTIYFIKHLCSCRWNLSELPENIKNEKLIQFLLHDRRNENDTIFCEIYDNVFLHYRAGGNWMGEGLNFHKQQSTNLKDALL